MDLEQYTNKNKIHLSQKQKNAFDAYMRELIEWNAKFNLTAITEPKDITLKHFIDSLSVVTSIPEKTRTLVDVGSGAGFPGLPIKILRPEISVTLVESVGKKTSFLKHIAQTLGLNNIQIEKTRAEEIGQDKKYREYFDVAVSRAVAFLPVLVEYMLPLVKVGGLCIAQKNITGEELEASTRAIQILGGKIKEILPVEIEGLTPRHLVIIEKISPTPKEFPRQPGTPTKNPL